MIARGGFDFSRLMAPPKGCCKEDNPWDMLDWRMDEGVVPAFADANSARWVLHKAIGDEIVVRGRDSAPVRVRLVGLFSRSLFASGLLISERAFLRRFGAGSGYRFFLVDPPAGRAGAVGRTLASSMSDIGLTVERTGDILARYGRVQNTYLSAFQTLGGIGLLLGTAGVVAALLRNAWERRAELALMLAVGFRRRQVALALVARNGIWMVGGVVLGASSSLVATIPLWVAREADVAWGATALILSAMLGVGLLACAAAAALCVRGDLIQALRSE